MKLHIKNASYTVSVYKDFFIENIFHIIYYDHGVPSSSDP